MKKETNDTIVKLDYEVIKQRILTELERETISDKDVGRYIGVSERQVRNARLNGLDYYKADEFCIKAFNLFAYEVYGKEIITCPESLYAFDLHEGIVTPEELMREYAKD